MWYGLFHSVSGFANAGFDILGTTSFIKYTDSIYINLVLIMLMLFGSLGFFVLNDIRAKIKNLKHKLQVHTKIVLLMTSLILVIFTILFKIAMPQVSLLQAFFNTISARNTGFASIDFSNVTLAGKFLIVILMVIGGAPGSNAGGIKLTSFFIILALPFAVLKDSDIIIFYRKIDYPTVKRAVSMVCLYILLIVIGVFLMLLVETNMNLMDVSFTYISAFTNTGLSVVDLTEFSKFSLFLMSIMMYVGRIGPITLFTMLALRNNKNIEIGYANADLML